MFESILFVLFIALIIGVVFLVMRWRMRLSLKQSLKVETKRVLNLSDEALQKRIRQAEKIHGNKVLNGFIGLFLNKEYTEYKDKLMSLYKEEFASRVPLA